GRHTLIDRRQRKGPVSQPALFLCLLVSSAAAGVLTPPADTPPPPHTARRRPKRARSTARSGRPGTAPAGTGGASRDNRPRRAPTNRVVVQASHVACICGLPARDPRAASGARARPAARTAAASAPPWRRPRAAACRRTR